MILAAEFMKIEEALLLGLILLSDSRAILDIEIDVVNFEDN